MDWYGTTNSAILLEIGSRIRATRVNKKFSQKEVAERAGISAFTVSQIETGKNSSTISLIAVMRVLKLLENLEDFIPVPVISPVELLNQQNKKKGKRK